MGKYFNYCASMTPKLPLPQQRLVDRAPLIQTQSRVQGPMCVELVVKRARWTSRSLSTPLRKLHSSHCHCTPAFQFCHEHQGIGTCHRPGTASVDWNIRQAENRRLVHEAVLRGRLQVFFCEQPMTSWISAHVPAQLHMIYVRIYINLKR